MKQKTLVLAVCMAFTAPAVSHAKIVPDGITGLNLGEIQSKSFLNEPFRGVIPLLFTDVNHAQQLNVRLAPTAIFNKIGAEKIPELGNLHFKVGVKNKQPVILITSIRPIDLPFLNFILEIESPTGKVYQDYTVMLDPRGYTNPGNTIVASQSKIKNQVKLPKTYAATHPYKQPTEYVVKSGDNLSKIAHKFKHQGFSLNKMMEVVFQKNPQAFIKADLNQIKTGARIKLPTLTELKSFKTSVAHKTINKEDINTTSSKQTTNADQIVKSDTMGESAGSHQYRVQNGDNLTKIVKKFKYENVSFTKMMKAIFTKNPHAFSNNKINLLKANALLDIPQLSEIQETTPSAIASNAHFKNETLETKGNSDKMPSQELSSSTSNIKESIDNDATAAADVAIIENLKNETNAVVTNLEKRVRILRKELSKSTSDLSDIEITLSQKENLLSVKEKEVKQLKSKLLELETTNQSLKSIINKVPENILSGITEDKSLLKDTEYTVLTKNSTLKNASYKEQASTMTEDATAYLSSMSDKKSVVTQGSSPTATNLSGTDQNLLSVKDLSYTALALFLGLLLIRYRKELYEYTSISYEHPKFYPADDELDESGKTELDYKKTLVNPDDHIETDVQYATINNDEINEETIQECEQLVDELLDELETNEATHNENSLIVDSVCDQVIDESMINNESMNNTNIDPEIENNITEILNDLTGPARQTYTHPTDINQLDDDVSIKVAPFEKEMDNLINSIKKDDKKINIITLYDKTESTAV